MPAASSKPQPVNPLFIGVDVGGTNIKLGIVADSGAAVAESSIPTHADQGAPTAATRIGAAMKELVSSAGVARDAVKRIGLVTPGPIDVPNGMILCPGNLPAWHNSPIRDLISAACGLPVTFANDANAAAYGEFWVGSARDVSSFVFFTMGTGIGGGIVVDDMLIEGLHGCGAELGHIIIDCADNAPINSIGIRGTLEGYCGAYAVVRRAEEALAKGDASSLRRRREDGEEITPLMIAQEAEAGDVLAYDIVMQTARYMAIGLVTAIHSIDPAFVAIGGAMTFGGAGHPLGEKFIERMRAETRSRLIPSLRDQIAIDFAALGGDAGYIGAAGLARREFYKVANVGR